MRTITFVSLYPRVPFYGLASQLANRHSVRHEVGANYAVFSESPSSSLEIKCALEAVCFQPRSAQQSARYMVLYGAPRTLCRHMALSAVHRGIAFEERSMHLLQKGLSMSLRRVGGKADGGIDLRGWWWLPSDDSTSYDLMQGHRRLRVLAQCKAEAKKLSPKYIREMEGVLHRFNADPSYTGFEVPQDHGSYPVVGLMISSTPFTKMSALHAHSSPLPFILLHLPEHDLELGTGEYGTSDDEEAPIPTSPSPSEGFGSIVFNPALGGANGVLRGQFEARWEHPSNSSALGRLGLWWKGTRIRSWTPDDT